VTKHSISLTYKCLNRSPCYVTLEKSWHIYLAVFTKQCTSYFAGSYGGAPIDIIRKYIENQQTPLFMPNVRLCRMGVRKWLQRLLRIHIQDFLFGIISCDFGKFLFNFYRFSAPISFRLCRMIFYSKPSEVFINLIRLFFHSA